MTLKFFKDHAVRELSEQCGTQIINEDVRWIVTVPAIWNAQAKQFMRQAAYEVNLNLNLNLYDGIISYNTTMSSSLL